MRKAAGVIIALVLPFVLAMVLLRMYFGVEPMDNQRFLNIFVEMPDFGNQVVHEFENLQSVLKEISSYADELADAAKVVVDKVGSGDLVQIVTGIFEYLGSVISVVGKLWWVLVRSVYFALTMVGLLLIEPVNIVVYFIGALITP